VGPPWCHLAVDPIPPAVTSVSAPNTRSLIYDHCGVGPGVRPAVLGQVSPEGAGGQGASGFGSESVPGGVPIGSTGGGGEEGEVGALRRAKHRLKSLAVASRVRRPLSRPCVAIAALSPITVLRLHMGRAVLHLCGRSAGAVWGDLALRRFSDWRAPAGARASLVLAPCQAAGPALTNLRPLEHVSMARTGAPGAPRDRRVGGFESKTNFFNTAFI
jgi:hypothetical protein